MRYITVLLFLTGTVALCQDIDVRWLNPTPQGNPLYGVYMLTKDRLTAVGDLGTVLSSRDGGTSWSVHLRAGHISTTLNSVVMTTRSDGIAVGTFGFILRTSDGGTTWLRMTTNTHADLSSVSFVNRTDGIAVGQTILRTTDGGKTWSGPGPAAIGLTLQSACYLSSHDIIAAGGSGVFKSSDGGVSWAHINATPLGVLSTIWASDPLHIYAGGANGSVYASQDGGIDWVPRAQLSEYAVIRLWGQGSTLYALTPFTVFRSQDRGLTWSVQLRTSPAAGYFCDLSFADVRSGAVVAHTGAVLLTSNGGDTWTNTRKGPDVTFWAGSFWNRDIGLVVGESGTILKTSDGGTNWEQQNSGTRCTLSGVSMFDKNMAVAVGQNGLILRTSDGGSSWQSIPSTTLQALRCVTFADSEHAEAGGDGVLLRSTDAGFSWFSSPLDEGASVSAMSFISPTVGMAVGARKSGVGVILKTSDGGMTWRNQEPSWMWNLWGLSVVNERIATAVGAWGFIVRTTDGGNSWLPQESPAGCYLRGVSFSDSDNGIAVGSLDDSPQGAIILQTTDGGSYWKYWWSGVEHNVLGLTASLDGQAVMMGMGGMIVRLTAPNAPVTIPMESDHRPASLLGQNYPNPFNPSTNITYTLSTESEVTVKVYDLTGRLVATLVHEQQHPGKHTIPWDAAGYPSGIYFYRLTAGGHSETRRLMLLK